MAQKKHIAYAQAKGAPAGFVLPYMVLGSALTRSFIEDVETDSPTNFPLNAATGLVRIHAIGGALFARAAEDVSASAGAKASVTLSLPDNPTHGDEMVVGEQEYTFRSAIEKAAEATLTLTGVITPGSHAESVLTANTILDGNEVTIGARTYRFKDTIAQIDDIAIGAGDAAALDNLKHAINGTGTPGTHYFTGTTANTDVVATDNADTTQKVVARVPGTAANALATTATAIVLSWADTTLGGGTGASNPGVAPETVTVNNRTYSFVDVLSETNGAAAIAGQVLFGADSAAALDNLKSAANGTAGAGTTYSTGTLQPTDVTATTNTNTTQLFVSSTVGPTGNAYASTATTANGTFAGATFVDGWLDNDQTIVIDTTASATQTRVRAAINGTGTAGTDYSSALVANTDVYCNAFSSDDAVIEAEAAGTDGNGIVSTETFTSSNNVFSAATLTGGTEPGNFDAYIPAGESFDFAPDEDCVAVSVIAVGASTDVVVVEY